MPTPPEVFARIGAVGTPVFSRDGRTLFHLRGAGLPQVWAQDLATGVARQLTFHDEKVAVLRRAPTDDHLIYGIDRGGDERQQLLLIDPPEERPEPRALTDDSAVIHDWGAWSPDGTQIAFAANARDEAHFDIYLQEVATGTRRCVYQGTGIVSVSGFHPDGALLTLLSDRGYADMSLLLLELESGEVTEFPSGSGTNYQSVRWTSLGAAEARKETSSEAPKEPSSWPGLTRPSSSSPSHTASTNKEDGWVKLGHDVEAPNPTPPSLLALTDHGGNFLRLCRLDPATTTTETIYAVPHRDVEAWAISSDGATLATIENDRGYSILRLGPTTGDRPIVANLPQGVITDPTFAPDGKSFAFTLATPTTPPSIWLHQDGTARPLIQPDPTPTNFVDPTLVQWKSFDDTTIPGWLFLPQTQQPASGFPAIIWVHGGPVGQSRPNFRPDIQMLVAQGFAVLLPNVRGSSGYGRASTQSDDVDKRPDCVADLAHGRHWLAAHPAIDAARIGIMGQSYGGFMVNAAITTYPDLWRAAVNYYGIADFVTLLAGTGPWRRAHRAAEYGDPVRDAELFARISPIHHIDRVQVPVLLAHGTRDPRVPYTESEQFAAALAERQKPVQFLTFDYAGHGFIRPPDRVRIYGAVAEFFATHLA